MYLFFGYEDACGQKKIKLTTPHHNAWAKLLNFLFTSFSIRYTANEANIRPKNPMYSVVISSCGK